MAFIDRSTIPVPDDVNFDDDDLLNRKDFGVSLENLINLIGNEGAVIALNSQWGSGKTMFSKMWKNYLIDEREKEVIYFDAFAHDYIEDPFIALTGKFVEIEEEVGGVDLKNMAKKVIPFVSKIALRYLLRGDLPDLGDDVENSIEGYLAEYSEEILEGYKENESKLEVFKGTLEDLVSKCGEIVFIIDELDRCSPQKAMRYLEAIKHFFNVKGVIFLLCINEKQLVNYVKHIYGDIESEIFLKKFIDISVDLPKGKSGSYDQGDPTKVFKSLLFKSDDTNFLEKGDLDRIVDCFHKYISKKDMPLRDVKSISSYLSIFFSHQKIGKKTDKKFRLILILCYFKTCHPDDYRRIREKEIGSEEILEKLEGGGPERKDNLSNILAYYFDEEVDPEIIDRFKRGDNRIRSDRFSVVTFYVSILDLFDY